LLNVHISQEKCRDQDLCNSTTGGKTRMKITPWVQHRMVRYTRTAAADLPPSRGHVEDLLRKGPASKKECLYRTEPLLSFVISSCNPMTLQRSKISHHLTEKTYS